MATEDNFLTEIEQSQQDSTFALFDNLASNAVAQMQGTDGKKQKPIINQEQGSDQDNHEEEEEPEEGEHNQNAIKNPQHQGNAGEDYKEELKVFAKNWVDSGRLPKDFVIDDTLTEEKIDKAVYDFKVESLANERVDAIIKEKGITEEELLKLRGQSLGVDVAMYNKLKAYTELSKAKFDELTDDNEADIREYLTIYYKDLQMPAKKIDSNIEDDLRSENLDETLNDASKHFAVKSNEFKAKIDQIERDKIKEKEDQKAASVNREKAFLASRNIAGFKLSEDQATFLAKALHEKNEVITLPDGRNVKTSLYFKKIHEATSDPQVAFLHKIKFLLDDMPGDSPVEQASKRILKGLGETIAQKTTKKNSSSAIPMSEI